VNYYPFHVGDYVSATRHLSWEEDAAYRRLLDTYYLTEKPLPPDVRSCCRLVLATTDPQRNAVEVVLLEFFELTDAGWINARADLEISVMRDKQGKQRDKANQRWQEARERANAVAHAAVMPRHDKSDAAASKMYADAMPPTPTPTPTPKKSKSVCAAQALLPDVEPATVADWLTVRRAKRSPLTATAVDQLRREAGRAGLSMQEVLILCCARNWVSFRADWDWQARGAINGHGPPHETAKQREARELFENLGRSRNDGNGNQRMAIDSTGKRLD
jgi:uncharacterized protein YdaU (DUF1376 family)